MLCADRTVAAVDNNSIVKFFYKGKVIKSLEEKTPFLGTGNGVILSQQ